MEKYKIGTIIVCAGTEGKIIKSSENFSVLWEEYDHVSIYDENWLNENVVILE